METAVRPARGNGGITIIEMMVVVAVAAILLAVGVPNLYEFVVRNRIEAAGNEFVAALNLARSEAIRRGRMVVIRNNAGNQNWGSGWRMFADDDGDNVMDAGEETIREAVALDSPMTLRSTRNSSPFISFRPDGRAKDGLPNVYVFLLCYDGKISAGVNRPRSWVVVVNEHGRVRLAKPDAGTGVLIRDIVGGEKQVLPSDCKSLA